MEIGSCLYNSISFYVILLFIPLIFLFSRKKSSRSYNLKLPPSPPKLPLLGNIHQLDKKNLHSSLKTLSDKYGPIMLLNLGQVPTLIVSSSEIVKEIVESHDVVFSSRPKTTASEILFYGLKNILFAPYGAFWRQARKVCVVELLSLKRVQSFGFVREIEVKALVGRVNDLCRSGKKSTMINLSEALVRAANGVVSRCILGRSYDEEDGSVEKLGELANDMSLQLMAFSVGDFWPWLKWMDVLRGFVRRLRVSFRAFDEFNERVVEQHKATRKLVNNDESCVEDFIDILLRIQQHNDLDFELTQQHVKAILQDMLAAGNDTTAAATEWLMAELIRNPRVMKKAQEEVRRVAGKKPKLDMNDINQMKYLKCVVKESLRLHPPAPLLAPRETTMSVEIRGYNIPAKTRVLVNAWAIQRDPGFWDQPEEFVPERFENNPVEFNGQESYHYIPFGFGRRRCPGLVFGIVNIECLVANLLYWFDWELPEGCGISPEELDMSESCGLSVHKKVPLHVVPIPYNP